MGTEILAAGAGFVLAAACELVKGWQSKESFHALAGAYDLP